MDSVCINQQDIQEKTEQVAAMGKIYGLAMRVVVWRCSGCGCLTGTKDGVCSNCGPSGRHSSSRGK